MFGETFGVTNGVITILSLVVGMRASGATKGAIVGAMVALLVSDPISDAYALYVAQRERDDAQSVATRAFLSQAALQLVLLGVVVSSPRIQDGTARCVIVGVTIVVAYERTVHVPIADTAKNLAAIGTLVGLTRAVETRLARVAW